MGVLLPHAGGDRERVRLCRDRAVVVAPDVAGVAMMRESIEEMDRAMQSAPGPRERAFLLGRLGESLETWGLPLDAYGAYASGAALDTTSADRAARSDAARSAPAPRAPRLTSAISS